MSLEYILILAVIIFASWWVFSIICLYLKRPRLKTNELAIALWLSRSPYSDAKFAEDILRLAFKVVFGEEDVTRYEGFMNGQIDKLKEWEEQGNFEHSMNLMQENFTRNHYIGGKDFKDAFQKFQDELFSSVAEATEGINDLLGGSHRIEAEKLSDGTTQFLYKQIWSDKKIEDQEKEVNDFLICAYGKMLIDDESNEARELLEFLKYMHQLVYEDSEMETEKDVGSLWFKMVSNESDDPAPELLQRFRSLNNAWESSRENSSETSLESDHEHEKLQQEKAESNRYDNYSLMQIAEHISTLIDYSFLEQPGALTKRLYEIAYFDNFLTDNDRQSAVSLLETVKTECGKIMADNPEALESYQSANKYMEEKISIFGVGSLAWLINENNVSDEDIIDFVVQPEHGKLLEDFLKTANFESFVPNMVISLLKNTQMPTDNPVNIIHQLSLNNDPRVSALFSADEISIFKSIQNNRKEADNILKSMGIPVS